MPQFWLSCGAAVVGAEPVCVYAVTASILGEVIAAHCDLSAGRVWELRAPTLTHEYHAGISREGGEAACSRGGGAVLS